MRVTVKLFARARDLAGTESIVLEIPEVARVRDVRRSLAERLPQLTPIATNLLVAVGNQYAGDDATIVPGVEIACFPPVSGG